MDFFFRKQSRLCGVELYPRPWADHYNSFSNLARALSVMRRRKVQVVWSGAISASLTFIKVRIVLAECRSCPRRGPRRPAKTSQSFVSFLSPLAAVRAVQRPAGLQDCCRFSRQNRKVVETGQMDWQTSYWQWYFWKTPIVLGNSIFTIKRNKSVVTNEKFNLSEKIFSYPESFKEQEDVA